MNNKGTIAIALLMVIVGTGLVVASNVDFKKVEGDMKLETSWTEQTKNNVKVIWCKMQNKGADYCNSLVK
jgi:hypothetical protein